MLEKKSSLIHQKESNFMLQTRLMAMATLAISLLTSGLIFWTLNTLENNAIFNDTYFSKDLGLLLIKELQPEIKKNDDLSQFITRCQYFYKNLSSLRYIIIFDTNINVISSFPSSFYQIKTSPEFKKELKSCFQSLKIKNEYTILQHLTSEGLITNIVMPLKQNDHIAILGINPNYTTNTSVVLTRDLTIAIFISIWIMVLLGAAFNALTITQPIKELLRGVKNITAGNFKQRIHLPFKGELGELIINFNEMAERLEHYQEQRIEELTTEKSKLETLIFTIQDGAILVDTELRIILINPVAQKIFNWENKKIVGTNILDQLPLGIRIRLVDPLYQMISQNFANRGLKKVKKLELNILETNKTKRTIRILLNPVSDYHQTKFKGIAITIQEITGEIELDEAKSQFLSNVSHELRTPLFNIKSFIETLYEYNSILKEPQRLEFLETANKETDRLTRLVNNVLDLSRLESGRNYPFFYIDVKQTIEQSLRIYKLTAKEKKIIFFTQMDKFLPNILGNYDLILQVLNNLIGNSLKFTFIKGSILIRAYKICIIKKNLPPKHKIRIELSDTGIGINKENQKLVFDRFFRVENQIHTLEGTGLGLSIVQNIIQKHNSRIHLVSEINKGSTFWFDFEL
uniref:Uncharacterized sensor-like histidine kinase ycf26 n=1 Tax=Glaucocystis incrassata TaxID=1789788 RepID=A0A3G1IVH0_9EUKA|nr:two-component signal transduction histidine kinase Ycf26 [Glaucocystis incrassata]ASQ40045.1 two-component signal transduction histidine kinase Ycf26 [Glaucocystis incrassata]